MPVKKTAQIRPISVMWALLVACLSTLFGLLLIHRVASPAVVDSIPTMLHAPLFSALSLIPPIIAATSSPAETPPAPLAETVESPVMESSVPLTSESVTPTNVGFNFGLSVAETLTGLGPQALGEQLDDMKRLHVSWIRLDFDWAVIQRRGPDSYDWERIDRVVAAANARNIQLLPILVYTPRWARAEGCDSVRCPPADPTSFARFASVAAQRYAPRGIHTWEIWNEPNTSLSWLPEANPRAYAALLREASISIKKEDPSASVIAGGLAIVATRRGSIAPREYLSEMYDAGVGPFFDAVAFHPYSFPATPAYNAAWNAWQQMENTPSSIRSIMIAHGDADKKIWITEYGAPTNGPGEASNGYVAKQVTDHVTEELQKKMLIEAILETRSYAWAGPFFWYSYKDIGTSRATTENFYGLIRADGTPKPAYDALLQMR